MSQHKVNAEAVEFSPSTLLSLYELDATFLNGPHLYFHDGTNNNYQPITFNGIEYTAFPIVLEGFEYDGKGSLPRPKLKCSNINGFVSNFVLTNDNLIGAQFIRRRVFARFIDAVNFPNSVNPFGTPDPTAVYPDDIFYVNRKVTENQQMVEFELATPLEIDSVKLPKRQIFASVCQFKYRDESCGYVGAPISDKNNKVFGAGGYGYTLIDQGVYDITTTYNQGDYIYIVSTLLQTLGNKLFYVCSTDGTVGKNPLTETTNWIADSCSKNFRGCRLRFPFPDVLHFGGFPGVSRAAIQ